MYTKLGFRVKVTYEGGLQVSSEVFGGTKWCLVAVGSSRQKRKTRELVCSVTKTSIGGSDGLRASISGFEDEFFSDDVVTEFSDSGTSQGGSVKMSLDKDLFYTFSDGENGGQKPKLDMLG
ncbi:hypothetical protein Tco_1087034 [Tanacetum coccineum]